MLLDGAKVRPESSAPNHVDGKQEAQKAGAIVIWKNWLTLDMIICAVEPTAAREHVAPVVAHPFQILASVPHLHSSIPAW